MKIMLKELNTEKSYEQGVEWMLRCMSKYHFEDYMAIAQDKQNLILSQKMDAVSALAMWEAARVNRSQQRTITRHLTSYFEGPIIVPEVQITSLTKAQFVLPQVGVYKVVDTNEKISYWYRDVAKMICHTLELYFNENVTQINTFNAMDLVFGGDHGKGKFQMLLKIILRRDDDRKMFIVKVGYIDCRKDTYDVLKNTIGPHLNESIRYIEKKQLLISRNEDQTIQVIISESNSGERCVIHALKYNLVFTGDLAFYHTCVGREHMSSSWCFWCDASAIQWKSNVSGLRWSIQRIKDMCV